MFEALIVLTIFCTIGFFGWAQAEWRIRRAEFRVDAELTYQVKDLRARLATSELELEWFRSRDTHRSLWWVK